MTDGRPVALTDDHPDRVAQVERHNRAMRRLVGVVQELSLARSLEAVMGIVRIAARELTGADGATFVLRQGDHCFYADESAIAPLWKGQRFPMSICISGWVMVNSEPAVIEDIYSDARIPHDAYRPTFVKSLVMVPIRIHSPIGAIGNYWAQRHRAGPEEVDLLQALAHTTSVALENVQLYSELEQRVRERTEQLAAANRELESFSFSVSHDLQAPLRRICGFAEMLAESKDKLDDENARHVDRIVAQARHMSRLISDLLRLARFARAELRRGKVDLSAMAREIAGRMQAGDSGRRVELKVEAGLEASGDAGLLQVVLENLLSNGWKYTSKRDVGVIECGAEVRDGERVFFVRDNGVGFDMRHADKLFTPFERLHPESEFPGSGVGLATAQRIIGRHGGRIWVEAKENEGACFFFTLPPSAETLAAPNAPR